MRRLFLLSMLLLPGACAPASTHPVRVELPQPNLPPASFNGAASLVQRLTFERGGKDAANQPVEAMLEIDAGEVSLAGFALGQRILVLHWDGRELKSERHPRLPETVSAERVLRDIQYVFWPASAIRTVLPPSWSLDEQAGERILRHDGKPALVVRYAKESRLLGRAELENRLEGYRLTIDPAEQGGAH